MMNKIGIGLVAIAMVFTSCKKDLDLRPTDAVGEEAAYNSVAALQKALNTVYASYGNARTQTAYAKSNTSDEVKFGPNNGGSGQFGYRLQYNSDATSGSDVTAMFFSYYSMIDYANRALAKAGEVPANDAASSAQRDYIKGQLMALRAMGHFELLQAYSKRYDPADPLGIPIVTTSCLTC